MKNFKYYFFNGYFDIYIKNNKFHKIIIIDSEKKENEYSNDIFYKLFENLIKYNKKIPLKYIENPGRTNFSKKVYISLYNTNFGETLSYKELAEKSGSKNAFRAVGSLMKNNTLPIIIPCHRVIKSDGNLGNFGTGPEWKKALLDNEIKNEVNL